MTQKHDYMPSLNPMDQGGCATCGNSRAAHARLSPREEFNAAAAALGLAITNFTTDGWARSFVRRDGLHLWRISDYYHGLGIQTAWVVGDRYVGHEPFYKGGFLPSLRAAVLREGPTP